MIHGPMARGSLSGGAGGVYQSSLTRARASQLPERQGKYTPERSWVNLLAKHSVGWSQL
jgi:hypothetical protein